MSDLLERLKAGKSALGSVTVNGIKLGLRVLSEQDYLAAGLAAESAMKAAGVEFSVSSSELFEMEKSGQLLARLLVDPATGKPVAEDADDLREVLSREEAAHLFESYLDYEKTVSPSERNMSDADFEKLLEEVKKNPATQTLNGSSSALLRRLIATLASPPSN